MILALIAVSRQLRMFNGAFEGADSATVFRQCVAWLRRAARCAEFLRSDGNLLSALQTVGTAGCNQADVMFLLSGKSFNWISDSSFQFDFCLSFYVAAGLWSLQSLVPKMLLQPFWQSWTMTWRRCHHRAMPK